MEPTLFTFFSAIGKARDWSGVWFGAKSWHVSQHDSRNPQLDCSMRTQVPRCLAARQPQLVRREYSVKLYLEDEFLKTFNAKPLDYNLLKS